MQGIHVVSFLRNGLFHSRMGHGKNIGDNGRGCFYVFIACLAAQKGTHQNQNEGKNARRALKHIF